MNNVTVLSAALEARDKATPGPWRWELNLKYKQIHLCGGRQRYDLTVMDFTRWGMGSARPRVLYGDASGNNMLLKNAEDYRVVIPGREHHADWFQGIDHPDMNIIAAAPDALDWIAKALPWMKAYEQYLIMANLHGYNYDTAPLTALIAQAEGRKEGE